MDLNRFNHKSFFRIVNVYLTLVLIFVLVIVVVAASLIVGPDKIAMWFQSPEDSSQATVPTVTVAAKPDVWTAPDIKSIPDGPTGDEIRYGRELIAHTANYLGPEGSIKHISNGMNCQNCHLDAGTKPFGNNYSAVASTYPKFRARSGHEESIERRVNDCFERSLNGSALAEDSPEMKAMVAYLKWLGTDVPKGEKPKGSGVVELAFLDSPADPHKGEALYQEKCSTCHGSTGHGVKSADGVSWAYPPLWGDDSYNNGAGLYRLSRFAGYIKANMPLGASYDNPLLTDEEAWHIAAYVDSLPRPIKNTTNDWPDISKKPVDHPFGPFADGFDEKQHKYGPFKPIVEKRKELSSQDSK